MPHSNSQGTRTPQVDEVVEVPRVNGELIQPPSSASEAKNAAELFAYHLFTTEDAKADLPENSLWRNPATNTYILAERNPIKAGILKEGTIEYTEDELWVHAAANHYFAKKDSDEHKKRKEQWSKVLSPKK